MEKVRDPDNSLSQSKQVHDNVEEDIVHLMQTMKDCKDRFGFMEFFFSGVIYSRLLLSRNGNNRHLEKSDKQDKYLDNSISAQIIRQMTESRSWAKKMELTHKQKSLYYFGQFLSELNRHKVAADKKPANKKIELLECGKKRTALDHEMQDQTEVNEPTEVVKDNQRFKLAEEGKNIKKDNEVIVNQKVAELEDDPQKHITEEEIKLAQEEVVGDCPICLCDVSLNDLYCLDICSHVYHKDCMEMHLKIAIDSNRIPVTCPVVECKKEIPIKSVEDLLDKEYIKRFDLFSFKLAINKNAQRFLHCPTPECEYVFCVEINDPKEYFKCMCCGIEYCLNCESQWHEEMDCNQYQAKYGKGTFDFEDQQAIDHAINNKMIRCPGCHMWVFKEYGCDSIHCNCGTAFCYKCGKTGNEGYCNCA